MWIMNVTKLSPENIYHFNFIYYTSNFHISQTKIYNKNNTNSQKQYSEFMFGLQLLFEFWNL